MATTAPGSRYVSENKAATMDSSSMSNKSISTKQQITSISYENYAPRSELQRSRLSRIEQLTAGPTATFASRTKSSLSDSSSKKKDKGVRSLILMAMSPGSSNSMQQQKSSCGGGLTVNNKSHKLLSAMLNEEEEVEEDDDNNNIKKDKSSSNNNELVRTLELSNTKSEQLSKLVSHSKDIHATLRQGLNLGEELSNRHSELLRRSGELSIAAERLQSEEAMLSRHAEEIGMPLKHYDAIDRMGVQLGVLFKHKARTVIYGLPKVKVDSEVFGTILDDLDLAYDFFEERERLVRESHPERGEELNEQEACTIEYYRRVVALHDTALSLIKDATVSRFSNCANDIVEALNLRTIPLSADKLEASLVYTRFHGISSRCNSLIALIRQRIEKRDAYRELLDICRSTYCSSRETLLKTTIREHTETLREQHGLVGMTRLASLFLMRICTIETALFLDFFSFKSSTTSTTSNDEVNQDRNGTTTKKTSKPPTAKEDSIEQLAKQRTKQKHQQTNTTFKIAYEDFIFQKSLEKLCAPFSRTIRRGLVSLSDLDILCQIVSVLREEQVNANTSRTYYAASRVISIVIQDAQERLIFCANSLLRKDVMRFIPSEQELDYPNKLLLQQQSLLQTTTSPTTKDPVQIQLQIYESWFPPMRSVLKVLSKLFRVVEPKVFEDIAQQSVQACTKSLKEASISILMEQGVIHSDLFLVKHLLILREQLSPFDIQLRGIERQLDFSDAGKAMTKFLANRNRRLFSMSTGNALVTLLREGISVQESNVDSKRDLEDALRSACNDFIEHTSTSLAQPLFQFTLQCKLSSSSATATATTGDSGNATTTSTNSTVLAEVKTQPFLHASNVLSVLNTTKTTIQNEMETNIYHNMNIYLNNTATRNILLKPILRKIYRAVEETKKFIVEFTTDGDYGWNCDVRLEINVLMKDIESLSVIKGTTSLITGVGNTPVAVAVVTAKDFTTANTTT